MKGLFMYTPFDRLSAKCICAGCIVAGIKSFLLALQYTSSCVCGLGLCFMKLVKNTRARCVHTSG